MLRGNRDFQLYFIGQIFSMTASSSAVLALPLFVFLATDSATKAGLVGTVTLTAYAISMLPVGVIADRLPARALLVGSDLARAVAALSFTIAILVNHLPMWLILTYAVVESLLGTLFRASGPGALKRIVPGDQLVNALSWFQARNALAGIAGPAFGGALLAAHWAAPFAVKAAAHLVSVGTLLAIRTPLPAGHRHTGPLPGQLLAGLAFLWRDRFLRSALVGAACVNLVFGAVHSLVTLESADTGFEIEEIGLVVALAAVGGLIGATLAPRLSRLLTPRQVFVLVLGGGAIAVPLMALATNPTVLALIFATNMVLPPVVSVMVTAARVNRAPDELQGRAMTATALISMGVSPLGPLLSGVIVDNTAGNSGFLAYGAILAVFTLLALFDRGLGTYTPADSVQLSNSADPATQKVAA